MESIAAVRIPHASRQQRLVLAAVALWLLVLPSFTLDYLLYLLALGGINAIMTLSLDILTGYTGEVSIGHGSLMAVGAYTAAILAHYGQVPLLLTLAAGALSAGVVGLLLAIPCLRLRGPYLAVATMAFAWVVPEVAMKWTAVTGGYMGISPGKPALFGLPLDSNRDMYYLVLFCLGVTVWFVRNLIRSKVGRAFVALRNSEFAARASGINTSRYRVLAFTISSVIAGFGGALYAWVVGNVTPGEFGFMVSVSFLVALVLGGQRSIVGSILGGLLVTFIPQWTSALAWLAHVVYGASLIVVVFLLPRGLGGIVSWLWSRAARGEAADV